MRMLLNGSENSRLAQAKRLTVKVKERRLSA